MIHMKKCGRGELGRGFTNESFTEGGWWCSAGGSNVIREMGPVRSGCVFVQNASSWGGACGEQ